MLMQEINEELLKLSKFYKEANNVISNHVLGDDIKEEVNALISLQSQLAEKLTKAMEDDDFVFNASFYGTDISNQYNKILKKIPKNRYLELTQDLQSFANIHEIQSDQLTTIHELMSQSDSFNN